jgi:hypothetical protein
MRLLNRREFNGLCVALAITRMFASAKFAASVNLIVNLGVLGELREDGGNALREDGGVELREV